MCFDITIKLKDGRVLLNNVDFARDKPKLGRVEIEKKFRRLASLVLMPDRVEAIVSMVDNLVALDDVFVLAGKLVKWVLVREVGV